jgi:carbon monoxide dehydrogenase subunit G
MAPLDGGAQVERDEISRRARPPAERGGDVQIENQFDVPAPVPLVWEHLVDIPKVAPCFPRCRLTGTASGRSWSGEVTVYLGPISYTFPGVLQMLERNDEAHRVLLGGEGAEANGQGSAKIRIASWLRPTAGGTIVHISVDLDLEGRVAQYGRSMIEDVAARLVQIFADNFRTNLLAEQQAPGTASRTWEAKRDVGGLRLALWALWRAFGRLLGFGGKAGKVRETAS